MTNGKTLHDFPEFSTQRLLLRRFNFSDVEHVFKGLSHPDIIRYYGISYNTLETAKDQMTWFNDLERNGTGIWWAVCNEDNSMFLGAGGLNNLSKEHKKAEVGFWLFPEYWGQGIMTEAMEIILQYGFEKLQLHRIEGFVETANQNCKSALKKLEFDLEGTLKDCEYKNGKFITLEVYAKLNQ